MSPVLIGSCFRETRGSTLNPSSCFRLSLLACLLVGAGRLVAQSEVEGSFSERLEVHEVLLDVLVTDPEGALVLGLGRDDFAVEDNGRPVEIVDVSFYGNQRLPVSHLGGSAGPMIDSELPADRFFALLFDQPPIGGMRSTRQQVALWRAAKASLEWVDSELLPTDHVAVLGFAGGLRLYHDFTQDRTRLARAVERAAAGKPPDERWVSRAETPQAGITLSSLPGDDELRRATADPHRALATLAGALGTVRGRKNIVIFATDFLDEANPNPREADYRHAIEALNDHNVAVYTVTVDPRGRVFQLARLAEDTGGRHVFHFRTLDDPLRRISTENSGYYLLSYRAELPVGEIGYRHVAVRTSYPGLEVRTRSGYRKGD